MKTPAGPEGADGADDVNPKAGFSDEAPNEGGAGTEEPKGEAFSADLPAAPKANDGLAWFGSDGGGKLPNGFGGSFVAPNALLVWLFPNEKPPAACGLGAFPKANAGELAEVSGGFPNENTVEVLSLDAVV